MKTIKSLLALFLLGIAFHSYAQDYKHFIIYGQSLSVGHQSYPPLSLESLEGNYMIGNQINWNYNNSGEEVLSPLYSRVDGTTLLTGSIENRLATSRAENPLISAVNHLRFKLNETAKYIATSCGVGGQTIEQLSKGSYQPSLYGCFEDALSTASSIMKKENANLSCPAIIWMQGEQNYTTSYPGYTADSKCTADKDSYKEWLVRMKNNMQEDIIAAYNQPTKPVFITYQAGCQYIRNTEITVGMAQLEAANEQEDIICAGPVYPMTDRGGHLDSNGYRWFGEMLGKVYYKTQILGEEFKPLQPKRITRVEGNAKQLKVEFYIPVPPLVLDNKLTTPKSNYGFEVYVGKTRKTIKSVELVDDCIILTTTTNLTGDVAVIYAGQINSGHGNLRDSDDYQAYYNYIDLDGKDNNGKYIFSRDATETTLRPDYEPVGEDGNVIYNQPYPLHNFCVSFYYQLKSDMTELIIPNVATPNQVSSNEYHHDIQVYKSGNFIVIDSELTGNMSIQLLDVAGKLLDTVTIEKAERIYELRLKQRLERILLMKIRIGNNVEVIKVAT